MFPVRTITLIALLLLAVTAVAEEVQPTPHRLFHIERNKNANIVVYDALVLPDSSLVAKDPVSVYWLKLAEGGHRKGLKGIEKKMAYGFKVKSRAGNHLVLDLVADVGRDLFVRHHEGSYRAIMDIDGRPALLDKIFVFAKESGLLPKVEYLELFGKDLETGETAYEKFLP